MRLESLLLAGSLLLAASSAGAAPTYCCADDKGRQACSDVLPTQCYGRAYREINERGVTVRRVDAPLTAEQRAQKEAETKVRQEEDRRQMEQRRKDQALLNTYASDKEIDFVRDRTLADMDASVKRIEAKRSELLKKQKQLADEAEFYRKKAPPKELQDAVRTNELELKTQQTALDAKKQEMESVRAKYDEEKRRYLELAHGKKTAGAADSHPH